MCTTIWDASYVLLTLGAVIYMTDFWLINMAPKILIWHLLSDLPLHQCGVKRRGIVSASVGISTQVSVWSHTGGFN